MNQNEEDIDILSDEVGFQTKSIMRNVEDNNKIMKLSGSYSSSKIIFL